MTTTRNAGFNWKKGLRSFLFAYAVLVVAMFLIQRGLLYQPFGTYQPPQEIGLEDTQELRLPTADGQAALAWFSPPPEDSSGHVVVFFHGNGGSLKYSNHLLAMLQARGLGFLGMEYRGYPGYEDGKTTETNIYHDARAGMAFLQEQGYTGDKVILLGQSLGSGVAVQMATEYDVALLALISPFTSVPDAAADIYWYLPARYLALDRFDSYSKIAGITTPLYIFHGTRDSMIPITHGQALYERAAAEEKRFFPLEGQSHNRMDTAYIARQIADFIQSAPDEDTPAK